MENDIFCQIVAKKIPADIVFQDHQVTAFRDINPQAPVHIIIIPNSHIPSVASLTPEDAPLLERMFSVANDLARREGVASSGYRLVVNSGPDAGQSVAHLHLHLLGGRGMAWPPG